MIRDEEMIRDKLKFYSDKKEEIHLSLLDGYFRNGDVEEFKDDSIIFNDNVLGSIIIYLREIKDVSKRLPKQ